jgi:acetyl esterase
MGIKNKYDFYNKITPQMREVVEVIRNWNAKHPATGNWRQDYIDERVYWNEGGPQPAKIEEITIPGPHGDIPLRLHYPQSRRGNGVIVFVHGGGFYLGNNDTHSRIMRILADESGQLVAGLDYRLAPEAMFPVQVDETVAAARYFNKNGDKHGADNDKVCLAGDSGGATLCLAAALYLRDEGEKDNSFIKSLLLYYGAYGMRDSTSLRMFGNEIDGIVRELASNYYDEGYIRLEDLKSPYYDLLDNDLTFGIPPTLLVCGDADPLLDNSTCLHEILKDKGLTVEYAMYPGIMHGFLHYSRILSEAYEVLRLGADFANRHFQPAN